MRKSLNDIRHMVKNVPYPGKIPMEIMEHHVYLLDSGHSILCVLSQHWKGPDTDHSDFEIPIPVRYVLEKGHQVRGDFIIVEASYDPDFGLDVDEQYYEY